jgi:uncharacterized protein YrzB (UPF0473 family)
MINTELPALSISDDNGVLKEYYVLAKFNHKEYSYVALTRQDGNGDIIELFRCTDGGGDVIHIENIVSDTELEEVSRICQNLLESETEEQENIVISISDESGNQLDCEIINTFVYNGNDYIAVMPIEQNDDENIHIMLFAYSVTIADGIENMNLDEIDENLYDDVSNYYIAQIVNEN